MYIVFTKNHIITIALLLALSFGAAHYAYADEEVLTPEQVAEQEEEEREKEEERKKLEEKEEDLEDEIEEEQKKLERYRNDLGHVSQSYSVAAGAVSKTKNDIEEKELAIDRHEKQISSYEKDIDLKKTALSSVFRELYFQQRAQSAELAQSEESALFGFRDYLNVVRAKATAIIVDIKSKRDESHETQLKIAEEKKEQEGLLSKQYVQQQALAAEKAAVEGKVNNKQADIAQLSRKLSAVQSNLSSLLGESVSTDDIVEAAEYASKKTGVRKGFILGMLIVETDLGRYTGGCTYKESRMNDHRKKLFKEIAKELDYNYKKLKVSCPPKNYKGTGGAMGVAQFMSDTWMAYQSKIASKTGNNPPDPWSLSDGVMAMALKLKNDGGASKSGEWNAAARYLGSCNGSTRFYCENVLYWADNYKKKL